MLNWSENLYNVCVVFFMAGVYGISPSWASIHLI
jgi:hypothetical protein